MKARLGNIVGFAAGLMVLLAPMATHSAALAASTLHQQCPERNVGALCGLVSSQNRDPDSGLYEYQSVIYAASCVDPAAETPEDIRRKVQAFWVRYSDHLRCNTLNFSPSNGLLLKFAVARSSDRFLRDAVQVWRVDLNRIDPVDGKTVLDFIEDELVRNQQPAIQRRLRRYYGMLREAGAKHRRELP